MPAVFIKPKIGALKSELLAPFPQMPCFHFLDVYSEAGEQRPHTQEDLAAGCARLAAVDTSPAKEDGSLASQVLQ